jgi:valyl-tRNA synthetase
MPYELPKTYDFKTTEERLYSWWEQENFFTPFNDPRKTGFDPSIRPFVISIPPPNITGELHLGHPMFVSLEDLMIRHARMKGLPALWVPGTDHASIATQLQVEKMLEKDGLSRDKLGREEFIRRTWEWKKKYGGIITHQLRRLGASCDWSRERFTMDEGLSHAVREAFVRLHEKGLIYRGQRLINWAPLLRTAVSELEVEYSEEPGTLYFFKYRLADDPRQYIPVATTRPETILGDTAVAVHPEDERYQHFIGKLVLVPVLERRIPVIADAYVDRSFGTGALKITPGHDPNDYQIGQRHKLETISIFEKNAHLNENGGPYTGLDRFECRKRIWADMKKRDLVIKEEPYTLNIPRSQRGGEIVEPMISTQWFIKIQPLADAALKAVQDGRVRIVPEHFTKVYYNWLNNIQDWCISRQLWWGHRIPVWYCDDCHAMTCARQDPTECGQCHGKNIHQDPDVLDTWFSSGLWPFSTLGWPEKTPDLKYFYPTTIMETGYDILFFWVARMIMFGLEFTNQVPFHTVYLHGMVRDEHGQKMSKTKGNVIDPLVVIDQFGTDALRFSMLVGSTPGNDMNIGLRKIEANRNFANKVWNAGRFVINAINEITKKAEKDPVWTLPDAWIVARLNQLVRDVERLFGNYQYGEAGRQIYDFFWSEFADWYLEIAKLQLAEGGDRAYYTASTLVHVLDTCLRLLHPFTPFVTEEVWQHLKKVAQEHDLRPMDPVIAWEKALMTAKWPEPRPIQDWEEPGIRDFSLVMDIVRSIRNLRAEKKVPAGKKIAAEIYAGDQLALLESQIQIIATLAHLDLGSTQVVHTARSRPKDAAVSVISGVEIRLPLRGMVDTHDERTKLEKDLAEARSQIDRIQKLLKSDFSKRAPAELVAKEKSKLETFRQTAKKIEDQLKG